MKINGWLVSITAVVALASGCARQTASNRPDNAPEVASPSSNPQQNVNETEVAASPLLEEPVVASAPQSTHPLPVPNLIPPTVPTERAPQADTGRSDPFATLVVPPTISIRPSNPATVPGPPASSPANPSVSTVPVSPLPSLPSQPAPDANQLPSISVLPPAAPPRPLSETIEISGVVEVGGRTSVIVQVPDEHTSRYVHVGDYLGNGEVLVKRVEMGMDPVVILEENGIEVTRYIGNGSSISGLL